MEYVHLKSVETIFSDFVHLASLREKSAILQDSVLV